MSKVLTFKVEIEGLENKIWRKIEITDTKTVADLAYTILASFNSLSYHLYKIQHLDTIYNCMIELNDFFADEEIKDATELKLGKIDFSLNNKMIMTYDFGASTAFVITYIYSKDLEKNNAKKYPYIEDGAGLGMLDDISSDELIDIVNDIDKKGKSTHEFTPGYEREDMYDYRKYDILYDNAMLKKSIRKIKAGYEKEQ